MILNNKYWRSRWFKNWYLNTRDSLCKKYILSSNHQKRKCSRCNEDFFCTAWTESTTTPINKKDDVRSYKTCWNVNLRLPFLYRWNWRRFALHKMIPLKWQIMSVSTNKLSRFFAENACFCLTKREYQYGCEVVGLCLGLWVWRKRITVKYGSFHMGWRWKYWGRCQLCSCTCRFEGGTICFGRLGAALVTRIGYAGGNLPCADDMGKWVDWY